MGKIKISLHSVPSHVYFPGDNVSGHVQLNRAIGLDEGIIVILYGVAKVELCGGSDEDEPYGETQTFFEIKHIHNTSSGQTNYPFSFDIPNKSLPWTTTTPYGTVEYGVKAILKRPSFGTDKVSKAYQALPGETIPFMVEVDNSLNSEQIGNGKIQLIGIWVHVAKAKTKKREIVFHQQALNVNVSPREKLTIPGTFDLPFGLMPTQVECKLLKLMYKLRVICGEINGLCTKLPATVEADIVLGATEDHTKL